MYSSLKLKFGVDAPVVLASILGLIFALMIGLYSPQAKAQSGNVYRESGSQSVQNVTRGVVLQLREVKVQPRQQTGYVGATAGAAVGGLLGVALGNNSGTAARNVLGILGAAIGGLGGQVAAERIGSDTAIEVLVETQGPYNQTRVIAVVQPLPAPDVQVGQSVLILNESGKNRIIPAALRSNVNPVAAVPPLYENQSHSNQQWEQSATPYVKANWQH